MKRDDTKTLDEFFKQHPVKAKRGFAAMHPDVHRAIASRGVNERGNLEKHTNRQVKKQEKRKKEWEVVGKSGMSNKKTRRTYERN